MNLSTSRVLALTAIAIASLVSGCASPANNAVSSSPTTSNVMSPTPSASETLAECSNDSMQIGWGLSQGAAGTQYRLVTISNISETDCSLVALPQIFLTAKSSTEPLVEVSIQDGLTYQPLPILIPSKGVLDISIGTSNPDNYPSERCKPQKATNLQMKNLHNNPAWTYDMKLPAGETSWKFCTTLGNTPFIASYELEK